MSSSKKLVLFDIDGTLVRTTAQSIAKWRNRLVDVFREVFGKELDYNFDIRFVNGKVELLYFREFAEALGVSPEEFKKKFPIASNVFHTKLKVLVRSGEVTFSRIEEAFVLASRLHTQKNAHIGLITGNIEKNAWLKLSASNFTVPFEIGGFGDEKEDRADLVLHAIDKANRHFKAQFTPAQTYVVGDTIHDIIAAKKSGAFALGVATGFTDTKESLRSAGADLVVSHLMDEKVLRLFDL